MKSIALFPVALALFVTIASAQNTPLTNPLLEETETTITCELTEAPKRSEMPSFDSAKEANTAKGVYHYKLWIPKGYLADAKKQWPCMFIASPSGDAALGNMANYLKTNGFVVVMLVESRNGPWGPIAGNFLSAHDDVIKRVRIKEGQKFATGFSGGARASSLFVQARPGFAGLILQGAGPHQDKTSAAYVVGGIKRDSKFHVAMIMGDSDSNKSELKNTENAFARSRFRAFEFSGGHTWGPTEVFDQAMAWIKEKTDAKQTGLSR